MRETSEEVEELQRLIDKTFANINPHFAAIVTPKRRLTAKQVVKHLEGTRIVAFATVSPKGSTPWTAKSRLPRAGPGGHPVPKVASDSGSSPTS